MRAAAWCGTVTGYWWHKGLGEPVCAPCWFARTWYLQDLRLAPARRRALAGELRALRGRKG